MSTPRSSSNVYVLPPPIPVATPARQARRRLPVRLRMIAWWWRLRLTVREVTDALRRFGRPKSRAERDGFGPGLEAVDLPEPRRPAGPARIIEFDAARRRRAPR